MIDAEAEIREFLVADATLATVMDTRIYAGTDVPAVGYTPAAGPCICFKVRGGSITTQQRDLLSASVQFKCYGATEIEANECSRALFDALDQGRGGTMRWAYAEGLGQLLQDSERDKNWWFVLMFYTCILDDS